VESIVDESASVFRSRGTASTLRVFPRGRTESAIGVFLCYAERGARAHGDWRSSAVLREIMPVVALAGAP